MKIIPILLFLISILLLALFVTDISQLKKLNPPLEGNVTNITIGQDIQTGQNTTGQNIISEQNLANLTGENKTLNLSIQKYECLKNSECNETEICVNNTCRTMDCGECGYAKYHLCWFYECCSYKDCSKTQLCINHSCRTPECGACSYLEGRTCYYYQCCNDSDCNARNYCLNHTCTPITYCTNITLMEGEGTTLTLNNTNYTTRVISIEQISMKNYVIVSINGTSSGLIETNASEKVGQIRVTAYYIFYSSKEGMISDATLGFCYEDF